MRLVAGRGFAVELHREEVANRGRRSGKDAAGRGAVAKKLATPWRIAIGKKAQWQKCLAVMLNLEKSVHLQHKIN